LVRAEKSSDQTACNEYGLKPRTLRYYRQCLRSGEDKDRALVEAYNRLRERTMREWVEESKAGFVQSTATIRAQLTKIQADAEAGKVINPALMREVRETCAMFADINFTNSMVSSGEATPDGQPIDDKDLASNTVN
jgi:hypothetical protein